MFKLSDKIVFREIDNRIVLINLDTGFYYSLNEVGCLVFNQLLKSKEIVDIVDEIQNRFEVPEREVQEDLREFVESLKREKIILSHG